MEGACTFNQASGNEYEAEAWVDLKAIVAKGYEFKVWYSGATLVSSSVQFNYQMPAEAVTLTAKVTKTVFNPTIPSEPNGSQEAVQTHPIGDVNKDNVVNFSLLESGDYDASYDLNADGVVNILDIIKVVNISSE